MSSEIQKIQLKEVEKQLKEVEKQLKEVENQVKDVENQVKDVENQVKDVENQVKDVENQVKDVENQFKEVRYFQEKDFDAWTKVEKKKYGFTETVAYENLWTKDRQLSTKEEQLRKDKEQLRKDKEQLRTKEEQLRKDKEQLRKDKEQLRTKEEQLRKDKEQLRKDKEQLRKDKEQLRKDKEQLRTKEEQLRKDKEQLRTIFMANLGYGKDKFLKEFEKDEKRDILISGLQLNGPTLPLIGRESQLRQISEKVLYLNPQKTQVGILCATRGLGKTTLLKALIDPERYGVTLDNERLSSARAVGRLAVADLGRFDIPRDKDFGRLLCVEIIRTHLLKIFQGTYFYERVNEIDWFHLAVETAFSIWNELTNEAYGVNSNARPILLLDEVDKLPGVSEVESTSKKTLTGETLHHTYLSLAIRKIGNQCYVILSGSKDGSIANLVDYSSYISTNIPLTPFSMENLYNYGVNYLTHHNRMDLWPATLDLFLNDASLLELFYQTLQVPRLVGFALYSLMYSVTTVNASILFEAKVREYYGDAAQTYSKFSCLDLVHILFVCACGFPLELDQCIPGTRLLVKDLVHSGILFHYFENRYTTLLWFFSKERLDEISAQAKRLTPNINLSKCFFSFHAWINNSLDLYTIGVEFETIFANCFCIKHYLYGLVKNDNTPYVAFTNVYELGRKSLSYEAASRWKVDMGSGYLTPDNEVTDQSPMLPLMNHNNAVADLVMKMESDRNLHIQVKYSLSPLSATAIANQLEKCQNLLWVLLGIAEDAFIPSFEHNLLVKKAWDEKRLAFIDGSGCCNPMLIDLLVLLKNRNKGNYQ